MNQNFLKAISAVLLLSLLSLSVQAHPGHGESDFFSGVLHPLSGWDHLLAMLAVGMWAVQLGGRNVWALPCSFVAMMCLGAGLALTFHASLSFEFGIAASVLVLGTLIAAAVRLPTRAGMMLVGCFALLHGYAHGAEAPAQASTAWYLGGIALTTAVLHVAGIASARALNRAHWAAAIRWLGAAIAACGVALLTA